MTTVDRYAALDDQVALVTGASGGIREQVVDQRQVRSRPDDQGGLDGLTASLHGEDGEEGLIANSASPRWVRTDLGSEETPMGPAGGADTPAWLATFEPGGPAGGFWRGRERIDFSQPCK